MYKNKIKNHDTILCYLIDLILTLKIVLKLGKKKKADFSLTKGRKLDTV